MTSQIRAKIERSSLGTKQAQEARSRVSAERAAQVTARAARIRQERQEQAGG